MVFLLPIPRVWVMKFATRAVRVGAMGMDRNRDGWVDGRIAGWIERVGDSVKIFYLKKRALKASRWSF